MVETGGGSGVVVWAVEAGVWVGGGLVVWGGMGCEGERGLGFAPGLVPGLDWWRSCALVLWSAMAISAEMMPVGTARME